MFQVLKPLTNNPKLDGLKQQSGVSGGQHFQSGLATHFWFHHPNDNTVRWRLKLKHDQELSLICLVPELGILKEQSWTAGFLRHFLLFLYLSIGPLSSIASSRTSYVLAQDF